jgi:hypothetical protein
VSLDDLKEKYGFLKPNESPHSQQSNDILMQMKKDIENINILLHLILNKLNVLPTESIPTYLPSEFIHQSHYHPQPSYSIPNMPNMSTPFLQRQESSQESRQESSQANSLVSQSPPPNKLESLQSLDNLGVRDFGLEDCTEIFEKKEFMKSCFQNHEKGILSFIDAVWFDKAYNKNFRVINVKTVQYYQYKKWNNAKIEDHLDKLVDYIGVYYQQFLERSPIIDPKSLDNYMLKIGCPLEWDLSHDEYDFNEDINTADGDDLELLKKKIHKIVKKHLLLHTENDCKST